MRVILYSDKFNCYIRQDEVHKELWHSSVDPLSSENVVVNIANNKLVHHTYEYEVIAGKYNRELTTKTYNIRRSKGLGDWMRAEVDQKYSGFNPCPGWISDVLNCITEHIVIKTIVE